MAPWVKCLLYRHEDLSSDIQHPHKIQAHLQPPCWETRRSQGLAQAQQSRLICESSRLSEKSCLNKQGEKLQRDTQQLPLAIIHAHWGKVASAQTQVPHTHTEYSESDDKHVFVCVHIIVKVFKATYFQRRKLGC